MQNDDSSCSISECNASNTASTPNISDVCTAAAVDTACGRGSVLLITCWYTSMSRYKGTVSRNDNIPDVCTAAAVDTAYGRGSVLLITYWYIYQYEYVQGTVCLSKRTHRYSHEARMNVLSVEQHHTTYCKPR